MLTLGLGRTGDALWRRVACVPSGSPLNSIVQLGRELGVARNPLINASALVVTNVILAGRSPQVTVAVMEILFCLREPSDDASITVDREAAQSEADTGFRNVSLENFIEAFGNLVHPVEHVLVICYNQCALRINCVQLARASPAIRQAVRPRPLA